MSKLKENCLAFYYLISKKTKKKCDEWILRMITKMFFLDDEVLCILDTDTAESICLYQGLEVTKVTYCEIM